MCGRWFSLDGQVQIYPGDSYKQPLLELLDPSILPARYGGLLPDPPEGRSYAEPWHTFEPEQVLFEIVCANANAGNA